MNVFQSKPLKLSILFTTDELADLYSSTAWQVTLRLEREKITIREGLALSSLLQSGRKIESRLSTLLSARKKAGRLTLPIIDYALIHATLIYCPGRGYFFNSAIGKIDQLLRDYDYLIELDR